MELQQTIRDNLYKRTIPCEYNIRINLKLFSGFIKMIRAT